MPLNFGGQKRSGAFDMVWPPANTVKQSQSIMIKAKMATLRAEANADPDLGDSLALIPDLLSVLAAAGQANLLAMLSSTPTPWMDAVAKVGGLLQLHKHNC